MAPRWREAVTARVVLMLAVATAILFATVFAVRGDGTSMLFRLLVFPLFLVQALFMSALVVYLCRNGGRLVTILACYGRLGLTNYFFQGVVGVTLFCVWFAPHRMPLAVTVAVMSCFYMVQMACVVVPQSSLRPLEYLWRKATGIFPSRKDSTACGEKHKTQSVGRRADSRVEVIVGRAQIVGESRTVAYSLRHIFTLARAENTPNVATDLSPCASSV